MPHRPNSVGTPERGTLKLEKPKCGYPAVTEWGEGGTQGWCNKGSAGISALLLLQQSRITNLAWPLARFSFTWLSLSLNELMGLALSTRNS